MRSCQKRPRSDHTFVPDVGQRIVPVGPEYRRCRRWCQWGQVALWEIQTLIRCSDQVIRWRLWTNELDGRHMLNH